MGEEFLRGEQEETAEMQGEWIMKGFRKEMKASKKEEVGRKLIHIYLCICNIYIYPYEKERTRLSKLFHLE